MFALKRNQIIVSALAVMIVVAGYLNYVDTTNPSGSNLAYNEALKDQNTVGSKIVIDETTGQEVMVVNSTKTNSLTSSDVTTGDNPAIALTYNEKADEKVAALPDVNSNQAVVEKPEEIAKEKVDDSSAVFVNSSNDSSFFIQAKLEREQSRSKEKETLTELINNANIEKEQKAQSAANILTIQQRIEKETATEALIEAKGFTEAYVRIDDKGVDVVVSKSVLSDAEIAQIEDIVKRKTGFNIEDIKVSPLKPN